MIDNTLIKKTIYINEKAINTLLVEKKQALKAYKGKMTEQDKSEFHTKFNNQYHALIFSHGEYKGERDLQKLLKQGDEYAMEYAVCFIEIRPYFFRSGYLYKNLLRWLNKAPLSAEQRHRYTTIKQKYKQLIREYRKKRDECLSYNRDY